MEGARLPARALHYTTLTVVSRAAGANMRRMQMKGAAGRSRGRRCKGVWNQCRGGKQHCVHCANNAESQCRVSQVQSGYDGHERRDSESAILFFFLFTRGEILSVLNNFLSQMTIAQHQQNTTGNSISVSALLSTRAP